MSKLGHEILLAMRDQGWLITNTTEAFVCTSPDGSVILPNDLIHEPEEDRMRAILLSLIVVYGLIWPWPPDHREEVYGEVPTAE